MSEVAEGISYWQQFKIFCKKKKGLSENKHFAEIVDEKAE